MDNNDLDEAEVGRVPIVVIISFILLTVWITCVFDTRAEFQNIASVDPLAMVHALFPWFWVLLLMFATLCIAVFHFRVDSRWLHILLLSELSLFLFFTPFVLSGFSWSPDSLWHGGIASYMPEILEGSKLTFSSYAESYPLSFMTTYCVEQVSGIDIFSYTLYLYPLICIILMTVLAYVFASRFLSSRNAFVSILLALPALHFIEAHVSPFSAGTVLVLVSFVLLTVEGRIARILNLFIIVALILTHPISPISLGIFLVTQVLLGLFFKGARRYRAYLFKTSNLASLLVFLGITWSTWTIHHSMQIYKTLEYAIADIVTLRFLDRLLYVSEWTAGGQGFVYPEIHQLNLEVYAAFLLFVCVLLFSDLSHGKLAWRKNVIMDSRVYRRIALALSSIAYAAFGYMLFLTTNQRFLLGRGLIFYIFTGSMCISMYLVRQSNRHNKFKESITFIFLLFLLLSYPIISYSKEAYNTFTPSSGYGLTFIASNVDLSRKSMSMGNDQQLAAYVNVSEGVLIEKYPPILNETSANFIVLRINIFFVRAMRIDLSFEDNEYIRQQDSLREDIGHNKIYCSLTFKVYSSNKN